MPLRNTAWTYRQKEEQVSHAIILRTVEKRVSSSLNTALQIGFSEFIERKNTGKCLGFSLSSFYFYSTVQVAQAPSFLLRTVNFSTYLHSPSWFQQAAQHHISQDIFMYMLTRSFSSALLPRSLQSVPVSLQACLAVESHISSGWAVPKQQMIVAYGRKVALIIQAFSWHLWTFQPAVSPAG